MNTCMTKILSVYLKCNDIIVVFVAKARGLRLCLCHRFSSRQPQPSTPVLLMSSNNSSRKEVSAAYSRAPMPPYSEVTGQQVLIAACISGFTHFSTRFFKLSFVSQYICSFYGWQNVFLSV